MAYRWAGLAVVVVAVVATVLVPGFADGMAQAAADVAALFG